MTKAKEVKIETEPFPKAKIENDLKKVDFVYHLHYYRIKKIKTWLKEHNIVKSLEEKIIYIHRYPSSKNTLIGIKRLKELTYFI